MVSAQEVVFCAVLFALLGYGWVKGYDIMKKRAPGQMPKFVMAYAAFRMITIMLVVAVYVFLISDSMAQSKGFVIMIFIMYAAMMALTLKLKH